MYCLPLLRRTLENVLMAGVKVCYLESAAQTLCLVSTSPFGSKCAVPSLSASDLILLVRVEKRHPIP